MRFLSLCAILALQLAAFPARELFADQTPSGVRVEIPAKVENRLEIMRLFSAIDRECSRLLKTPTAALYPLRVELLPDASPATELERFTVTRRGRAVVLRINGDYHSYMLEREPMLVVTGFFLLSRCGLDPDRCRQSPPLFVAAGIAENVLQRRGAQERRLPVRVQDFPAIRRIFLLTGGFDLRRIVRSGTAALQVGGGAYGIFAEASRMAVEILSGGTAGEGSALAGLVRRTAGGESFDSAFTAAAAEALAVEPAEVDAALAALIHRKVFTPNNPFPPSEQKRRLAAIRRVTFTPEEGAEVTADLSDLPRLIARYGAAALALRDRKRAEVAALLAGADASTAPAIHKLSAALERVGASNPGRASRELAELLASAEAAIADFERREYLLSEAEAAFVPARALYRYSFEELSRRRDAVPPNVLQALEKASEKLDRR